MLSSMASCLHKVCIERTRIHVHGPQAVGTVDTQEYTQIVIASLR